MVIQKVKNILNAVMEYSQDQATSDVFSEEEAEEIMSNLENDINKEAIYFKISGKDAPVDSIKPDKEQLFYCFVGTSVSVDDDKSGPLARLMLTDKRVIALAYGVLKKELHVISYDDIIGVSIRSRVNSTVVLETPGPTYEVTLQGDHGAIEQAGEYIRQKTGLTP